MTRLALLVLAFALATMLVGWWGVPLVALAAGIALAHRRRVTLDVTAAALLAWALLLAWDATRGPMMALAARLAPVFSLPHPALFLLLPLLYVALLAWSAARVGEAVGTLVRRKRAPERDAGREAIPTARDRASA